MQTIQTINDINGVTTNIVIPIEIWQKIFPKIQQDIQPFMQNLNDECYHDLDKLFGCWTEQEFQAIQNKINQESQIDTELWI